MRGGDVTIDSSTSSQFISALLLIAPKADDEIVLRHRGAALPSEPHIAMTVSMLRDRGVAIDTTEHGTWRVTAGTIAGGIVDIEPDLSNAAPFLAAAMVTGGTHSYRRAGHDTPPSQAMHFVDCSPTWARP